jgi:hypothetical protein
MPRRVAGFLSGTARRGAARKPRFAKGTRMSLLANPGKNAGTQEASGIRVAFSLDTFFWRSKRKYLAFGCENPIKANLAIATQLLKTIRKGMMVRNIICLRINYFHATLSQ